MHHGQNPAGVKATTSLAEFSTSPSFFFNKTLTVK